MPTMNVSGERDVALSTSAPPENAGNAAGDADTLVLGAAPPPMVATSAPPPPDQAAAPMVGTSAPTMVGTSAPPPPDQAAAPDNAYCDVVRRYVTAAECARFREQLARLESGVTAFRTPRQMLVGQPSEVRLAIGAPEQAEEVAATAGGSTTDGRTKMGTTRIGRIMRARLEGSDFDIVAVGDAERDLGATSEEVWIWRVTPRDRGQHQLTAVLEVLAERGESGRERLAIYRGNATIEVDVTAAQKGAQRHQERMTALQRLKELLTSTEGVLAALAAVLAAIGLVVWRVRRIGKDPAQRDDDRGGGGGGGGGAPPAS
ncbi:MAG TPA: hypothetical protein VK614_07310 [Allosphingosinicella sp.]|nr:hypothetical protein [Allosphingosinicella sp.]